MSRLEDNRREFDRKVLFGRKLQPSQKESSRRQQRNVAQPRSTSTSTSGHNRFAPPNRSVGSTTNNRRFFNSRRREKKLEIMAARTGQSFLRVRSRESIVDDTQYRERFWAKVFRVMRESGATSMRLSVKNADKFCNAKIFYSDNQSFQNAIRRFLDEMPRLPVHEEWTMLQNALIDIKEYISFCDSSKLKYTQLKSLLLNKDDFNVRREALIEDMLKNESLYWKWIDDGTIVLDHNWPDWIWNERCTPQSISGDNGRMQSIWRVGMEGRRQAQHAYNGLNQFLDSNVGIQMYTSEERMKISPGLLPFFLLHPQPSQWMERYRISCEQHSFELETQLKKSFGVEIFEKWCSILRLSPQRYIDAPSLSGDKMLQIIGHRKLDCIQMCQSGFVLFFYDSSDDSPLIAIRYGESSKHLSYQRLDSDERLINCQFGYITSQTSDAQLRRKLVALLLLTSQQRAFSAETRVPTSVESFGASFGNEIIGIECNPSVGFDPTGVVYRTLNRGVKYKADISAADEIKADECSITTATDNAESEEHKSADLTFDNLAKLSLQSDTLSQRSEYLSMKRYWQSVITISDLAELSLQTGDIGSVSDTSVSRGLFSNTPFTVLSSATQSDNHKSALISNIDTQLESTDLPIKPTREDVKNALQIGYFEMGSNQHFHLFFKNWKLTILDRNQKMLGYKPTSWKLE